ncbi:MAG: primosomal protein N' [Fimbriimonadales bacterium]|nr:MAG: primosomal protein N' [Fimbriimonadales bacterium]
MGDSELQGASYAVSWRVVAQNKMVADVLLLTGGVLAYQTLTYVVPDTLIESVRAGVGVLVPLQNRLALGLALGVHMSDAPTPHDLKPIAGVLSQPLLSDALLSLMRLMERTLFCSPAEAAQAVLPAGVRYRLRTVIELLEPLPALRSAAQRMTAAAIRKHGGRVSLNRLKRELAAGVWQPGLRGLREKGCIRATYALEPPPTRERPETLVELSAAPEALEAFFELQASRAPAQAALLMHLLEHPEGVFPRRALLQATGASLGSLRGLESRGLVRVVQAHAPPAPAAALPSPVLTPAQAHAVNALRTALEQGAYQSFLLFGVTGSGKTEVYLRAAAECLRMGRNVLVLVPEISLTAQLSQAFRERFGAGVALWHSQLSPSERYGQWLRIQQGDAPIVVGARSAIFAPLPSLGLIIVDEEHESSYKQSAAPVYHTRTLAEARARESNALLLLGSATPALETFYRAEQGALRRLELPERVGGASLPETQLIDQRGKPFQPISPALLEALQETLARGEQAILFLNRRGYAPLLLCRECGFTPMCTQCSVALVYHRGATPFLLCHHCGHREMAPATCPRCNGLELRPFGVGTQRIETTLQQLLPDARTARLDRDAFARRGQYLQILADFRSGALNVLIGTQMAARGLDFPRVTLVGVISADTGLYLPDFRASERVFQLLTQVIGRAGRRQQQGRALIQTYNPDHPAVQCALRQDYGAFYTQELETRREVGYPPFVRLVNLLCTDAQPQAAEEPLQRIADGLMGQSDGELLQVLGPAPAPLERLEGRYRYHLLLKFAPDAEPAALLTPVLNALSRDDRARVKVDVDPMQLL